MPGIHKHVAKVRKTGFIADVPRPDCACTLRKAESVPTTSTRNRSDELNTLHTSLRRILQEDLYMTKFN